MKRKRVKKKDLATELKMLLKMYPKLVVVKPEYKSEDGVRLYCKKCKEELFIEQRIVEASELRYYPDRGFVQGKPFICDGSDSVRCGCGTKYTPIEEWEPY
jgi:hypothetical protein